MLRVGLGPGGLAGDGQAGGWVEVQDGDAGQGGQVLGGAGACAVGFDEGAGGA